MKKLTFLLSFFISVIYITGQRVVEFQLSLQTELGATRIDTLAIEELWIIHKKNYPNDSLMLEQFYFKSSKNASDSISKIKIEYKENAYYENGDVLSKRAVVAKFDGSNTYKLLEYNWFYNKKGKLMIKEKERKTITL